MKFKKLAAMLSLASTAVFFSGAALAAPSITNLDGTKTPFGGFDWDSSSAAWTTGFTGVPGSNFNLHYTGVATSLQDTGGNTIPSLFQLDNTANGIADSFLQQLNLGGSYEYTVVATFTETIIGCSSASVCTFQVTGGTFDIYYDTAANAKKNSATWTGFNDGALILSGTFFGGSTTQFDTATGGQAALNGLVTYTNAAFINPALTTTNVTSTLQLGGAATGFTPPTSVDGVAINNPGQILFQADANQSFSDIPEPSSLALVGLALTGVGFMARRRKSA